MSSLFLSNRWLKISEQSVWFTMYENLLNLLRWTVHRIARLFLRHSRLFVYTANFPHCFRFILVIPLKLCSHLSRVLVTLVHHLTPPTNHPVSFLGTSLHVNRFLPTFINDTFCFKFLFLSYSVFLSKWVAMLTPYYLSIHYFPLFKVL